MSSTLQGSPALLAGMVTKTRKIDRRPTPGAAQGFATTFRLLPVRAVRVLDCVADFKVHAKTAKPTPASEDVQRSSEHNHATHSQHSHLPEEDRRFSDRNLPGRRDRNRCRLDDRAAADPEDGR